MRPEIIQLQAAMRKQGYVAEPSVVTAVYLARAMKKPLLVEGDAGVGKTEIAKVMAAILDTQLIRLQCYEGLDASTALYEWNYPKQLLRLRIAADSPTPTGEELEDVIFGWPYLLQRPLLRAITQTDSPPVLLIDEIDRADGGFEAFLLEVLSDFQVTIPELGTIRARRRPFVVLTSNRTRELGDALRRRCLYLYIEHPSLEKETEIILAKVPGVAEQLARQIARFAQGLRARRMMKPPGIAETLDWASALVMLHREFLDAGTVAETLGCMVKDRDDLQSLVPTEVGILVAQSGGVTEAAGRTAGPAAEHVADLGPADGRK